MRRYYLLLLSIVTAMLTPVQQAEAQTLNPASLMQEGSSGSFNPHRNDTTNKNKEVPKGIYVWTVDRRFGDIIKAEVDTMPHLYPQSTLPMGHHMEYNTIGNNYAARQNRIFIDRKEKQQFAFTDVYSQIFRQPDEWHFTNTLSPITNLAYDNCGDKLNGEDHIDAKFAVNANKQLGIGMDLNYAYGRGYYQNQSTSHFGASFYISYMGDRYQMHALYSTHHEKTTENGGITNDDYITHSERFSESYSSNEIPTILQYHWNRNDNDRFFLTHRYNVGFYRKVKMTDEEIEAKKFAMASAEQNKKDSLNAENQNQPTETAALKDSLATDSTAMFMKDEYVPVTSFIHTAELGSYERRYLAYQTPDNFFANTYYNKYDGDYGGDSIRDDTKYFGLRNTVAVALLEGFNKYVPAGLKVFASHEMRRFQLPVVGADSTAWLEGEGFSEHSISIGGQLQKTMGRTLHYNLLAEAWIAGEDAGQMKLEGSTDLNFAFMGDTVRLAAKAYMHRLNPTFYERKFHSKHLWWDNDLDKEMRTRIEGDFVYEKTKTRLRVAIEEIQNYTYYGMNYQRVGEKNTMLTAAVRQHSSNLNVMTAQLDQKLKLGPLHWDNIVTYQLSSDNDVLPLPSLNVFSNLYFQFMVAGVLRVELGAAATWFTNYKAPDFCPTLNQYAVQENPDARMEIGNFPFVDAYANLHLKHARFFLLMQNALADNFKSQYFLVPHYPMNASVLHMGISWNFFN
ncbi:MAG: putative porin [Prevotella sp.]|nr:putative porin [Prevotella sp.]